MIEKRPLAGDGRRTRAPVHTDQVACPKCGTELEIAEVLAERVRSEMRAEIAVERNELKNRESALQERLATADQEIDARVSERITAERETVRAEVLRDEATEKEALTENLEKARLELQAAKKAELQWLQQREQFERDKEDLELTVARKMAEERKKIRSEAKAEEAEQRELDSKQYAEQIAGLRRTIEDLKRKAEQGSQQTQGEALEVSLEDRLREAFPNDVFEPVPKGFRGADLIQRVCTPAGAACGTILWEAKRTKHWQGAWLPKLRDDQRELKAEIAALVSTVLPQGVEPFANVENVWVSNYASAVGLASALRIGLIETARTKQALVGRSEKMEVLYGYLSGPEFRNRIEGLLEPFQTMREDLDSEKRSMQRLWAKREKQIERAMGSTSGLYGDLQGIVGAGLLEIEALDLPALEDGSA